MSNKTTDTMIEDIVNRFSAYIKSGDFDFTQNLRSQIKEVVIAARFPVHTVEGETYVWVTCTEETFKDEDWEFYHYRYLDGVKLETHVWDVNDGYLQKKGGTGKLPFNQIHILERRLSPSIPPTVEPPEHINGFSTDPELIVESLRNSYSKEKGVGLELNDGDYPSWLEQKIVYHRRHLPTVEGQSDFLEYIADERDSFLEVIKVQDWDNDLRTCVDSFIIAYDKMVEFLERRTSAPAQVKIIDEMAGKIVTKFDNHIVDKDSTRAILKRAIATILTGFHSH